MTTAFLWSASVQVKLSILCLSKLSIHLPAVPLINTLLIELSSSAGLNLQVVTPLCGGTTASQAHLGPLENTDIYTMTQNGSKITVMKQQQE